MPRLLRHALLALLAAWMPLCCCEVRAMVQSVAKAASSACARPADGEPACCCDAADDAPAAASCCAGGGDHDGNKKGDPRGHGRCCSTCDSRIGTPPAPPASADFEATLNPVATLLRAEEPSAAQDAPAGRRLRRDTGPPDRPAGRDALAMHATLVI